MNIQPTIPTITAPLHLCPDFTGRVLLHVENGTVLSERCLAANEHVATLPAFVELARLAGWRVLSEQGVDHA